MGTARPPNPERLLADARRGSAGCLGSLLELYRNYLHLLARTQIDLHLQSRANPSDLVQETFLEATRDFGDFRGSTETELLAWLRRILVHNLATLVEQQVLSQKRSVRREVPLDGALADLERSSAHFEIGLAGSLTSPSVRAERRERAAILADQLARLPADYREVIVLRNLESLPFDEVGRRMGRTSGAVRMLWLRALDRLRELLEGEDLI